MLTASKEHKDKLRKIKSPGHRIADEVRAIAKAGIVPGTGISGAYIQLGADITLYGLWEAILYMQTYEPDHYVPGTAEHALEKATSMLK